MRDLTVTERRIDALTPRVSNPRTHSKAQIRQIADSIETFGFTNPVLVDRDGGLIAGHGRVEAAWLLGLDTVPTICLEDLSAAQVRAYVIADNKLAENAGWDRDLLAVEFQYLDTLDLDFDLIVTGFEAPEIDLLIGEAANRDETEPDADDALPTPDGPAVTRPGDLWAIGEHRLLCGDATDPAAYAALLDGDRAQMVFTDPPYNVPVDGHVCGLGSVHHREFAMATGEMTEAEFAGFLRAVFEQLVAHSVDGAIHYVCMDWRHIGEVITAGDTYSELKNLCVWAKTNGGMGSLYRSQHELVFVYKAGKAPHINNVGLGKYGRNRTNVWSYAGVNAFGASRDEDLAAHPTVKPVALVADAILDCSWRGGVILDAFAGSGTTLLAAERTGRRGYGIEIDPAYCDLIVRRLTDRTGLQAVHTETGKRFEAVAEERARDDAERGADAA